MIIDFHTHCFPDRLADRAIEKLAANALYKPVLGGTVDDLLGSMKQAGVDRSVVLNIATNARQTHNVNSFAIELTRYEEFVPFGSVHPEYGDYAAELARLHAAGIKGIKFHPDFQGFKVDDRAMYPIYEKAAEYGFIMLFHCGHDLDIYTTYNCTPKEFMRVAEDFKDAKIVGAHLGGQDMWDEVFEYVCGKPVYVDTAYSFGWLTPEQLKRFLGEHDNDKIFFGSDSPWQLQAHDVELMKKLIQDKSLYNKLMSGNAAKLLGI